MNSTSTRTPTLTYHQILALVLALFSMGMTAFISERVFERLPHLEDEVAYLWEAKLIARGQTVIDSPQPRRAYWQPFVVDLNDHRFGKYTLGWPLILSIGALFGQPWLVNAFLSGLTVLLVYRLGLEIFDPDVGVIAAALTAFSPMALLLNGTLMGHTAALFTTMLFMFAYWRMEQGKHAFRWAVVAGIALGLSIINRPLAGLALAAPFVIWSGMRLVQAMIARPQTEDSAGRWDIASVFQRLKQPLLPLLALAVSAGLILPVIPLFNYAASGDASKNLYTLVWSYDQVGFGEGYGRNIHTLEKGIRQTRWDLSLTAADLFGWQFIPVMDADGNFTGQLDSFQEADGSVKPEYKDHLLYDGDYWNPIGLSWILLPFGLLLGWRRKSLWLGIWVIVGGLLFMHTANLPITQLQDPKFAVLWMAGAAVYLCIPCLFFLVDRGADRKAEWTYLLGVFAVFLVGLHVAYWIGSQRYSTRYYFEMLAPLAIISALPLAWLMRRVNRWLVYAGLLAVLVLTFVMYSFPRINALHRFNWVSPEVVNAVNERRTGDQPVLVLLTGADVKWRALGALMAVTDPLLDSDIVAAIDTTAVGVREQILERFPDRQVIEMVAAGNTACFGDTLEGECFGEIITP